jgi:hypothetical protein
MFTLMKAAATQQSPDHNTPSTRNCKMKKSTLLAFSVAMLASTAGLSNAFAHETTRAEVRQELIQAENNGSRFVTNNSYPGISPVFAQEAARLKQTEDTGAGADTSGSSASGTRAVMHTATASACNGPAEFCMPYFGN